MKLALWKFLLWVMKHARQQLHIMEKQEYALSTRQRLLLMPVEYRMVKVANSRLKLANMTMIVVGIFSAKNIFTTFVSFLG